MIRTSAPASQAAHVIGPTALSVLVHGSALVLLLAFSSHLGNAPDGDGTYHARAVPALDVAVEEDSDQFELRPLPEVDAEEFEEIVEEPELEFVQEEMPVTAPSEALVTLEPLDAREADVVALTLPTLAAARRHVGPEPAKPQRSEPLPPPVVHPVVATAARTISRPPPRPAIRRPASRGPAPSHRGRKLQALHRPIHYPPSARQRGVQGRTRVELSIDPSGRVIDVMLVVSSGHVDLDQAALASARQWRFLAPGERRRVRTWLTFRLT